MKLSKKTTDAIIQDGLRRYPQEACGFIVCGEGGEEVYPTANIAGEAAEQMFMLDTSAIAEVKARGKLLAIYHTHPHTPPDPSLEDLVGCKKSGEHWVICSPHTGELKVIDPVKVTVTIPLLGRKFSWGVFDCYALVKDWYAQELGEELPEFDRGMFGAWDKEGEWNKFEENFCAVGFEEVAPRAALHKGDVFLMNIRSEVINHCAVLVDPDKNLFMHHLVDRLSELAVYGGWWTNVTRRVVRFRP